MNKEAGLKQQLIPYFISSHPGCREEDMAELAVITKKLNFQLEQVQDFTPTPMTISTEAWYTGYNPYTLEPVFSAKTPQEKLAQRQFFFWYKAEERKGIARELRRIHREDLIAALFPKGQPASFSKSHTAHYDDRPIGSTYTPLTHEAPIAKRHEGSQNAHRKATATQGSPKAKAKPKSFNPNFRRRRK